MALNLGWRISWFISLYLFYSPFGPPSLSWHYYTRPSHLQIYSACLPGSTKHTMIWHTKLRSGVGFLPETFSHGFAQRGLDNFFGCSFWRYSVLYSAVQSLSNVATRLGCYTNQCERLTHFWMPLVCTKSLPPIWLRQDAKVGSSSSIGYLCWMIAITCIKCWIDAQPTHWPCITIVPACCIRRWLHNSTICAYMARFQVIGLI